MNRSKTPLYRKLNKTARGFHDNHPGGDFKHTRNTKKFKNFDGNHKSIKKTHSGFDYTPLYRFLLSKVGKNWNEIYKEAVSRLDKPEPIFHLVSKNDSDSKDYIYCGESSIWSKLFVDENNILQKVNPEFTANDVHPRCDCCTYTFNGKKVSNKYHNEISSTNTGDPTKKIFLG